MKRLIMLFLLLGPISLYGENIFDQLKKGAQQVQQLAQDVVKQKQELATCKQEYKVLEQRERDLSGAKDMAYQELNKEKKILEKQITDLETKLKNVSKRTGPPLPPPGAFDNKQLIEENKKLKAANEALTAQLKKGLARTGVSTPPVQKSRSELLKEIREGKKLKAVEKSKSSIKTKNSVMEGLADKLREIRTVVEPEEADENSNDEWNE